MVEGAPIALFQDLYKRLNTVEGAKDVYAEIIDRYAKHEINERSARALAYLMAGYLHFLKIDMDARIEERIDALERTIEGALR